MFSCYWVWPIASVDDSNLHTFYGVGNQIPRREHRTKTSVVTRDWTHHPLTVRQYQLFCLDFMYFIDEVYGFGFLLDLPVSPRCVLISVFFITLHRFSSPDRISQGLLCWNNCFAFLWTLIPGCCQKQFLVLSPGADLLLTILRPKEDSCTINIANI